MIKEEYISFETAKMLDGIEFHCVGCYTENGSTDALDIMNAINNKEKLYPRLPQSLLAKWLRESQHIYIDVSYVCKSGFYVQLMDMTKDEQHILVGTPIAFYETYEEAMGVGLQEALKLIK